MADTKSGEALHDYVQAFQKDLTQATGLLQQGRELLAWIAADNRGLNGVGSFLTSQVKVLEKMISDLNEEAETVEKKILGSVRPEITSTVDGKKVEQVRAARSAS